MYALSDVPVFVYIIAAIAAGAWLTQRYLRDRGMGNAVIQWLTAILVAAGDRDFKLKQSLKLFGGDDWNSTGFQNVTGARYQQVLKDALTFMACQRVADVNLRKARAAARWSVFPLVGGYRKAVNRLTEQQHHVSASVLEALPVKEVAHFYWRRGDLVSDISLSMPELAVIMSKLLTDAEAGIRLIADATEKSRNASGNIEALLAKVNRARSELVAKGVSTAPQVARLRSIDDRVQEFLSLEETDPILACQRCARLEQEISDIRDQLLQTIAAVDELNKVESDITKARQMFRLVRHSALEYQFPGESPPPGLSRIFMLDEAGGNPDPLLKLANEEIDRSIAALNRGDVSEASSRKEAAAKQVAGAYQAVQSVMEAKSAVENQATVLSAGLDDLEQALYAADQSLLELRADFPAYNCEPQSDALGPSRSLVTMGRVRIREVRELYEKQQFLTARLQMDLGQDSISSAKKKVSELPSRLGELKDLRKWCRDTMASCQDDVNALESWLQARSFIASAAIDAQCERLREQVCELALELKRLDLDWATAGQSVGALKAAVAALETELDEQVKTHTVARDHVAALVAKVGAAEERVVDGITLQPARDALSLLKGLAAAVQAAIQAPKSDWQQIVDQCQRADASYRELCELAARDKSQYDQAKSWIGKARSNRSRFSQSKSKRVSAANARLEEAEAAFEGRNWDEARSLAQSALQLYLQHERQYGQRGKNRGGGAGGAHGRYKDYGYGWESSDHGARRSSRPVRRP